MKQIILASNSPQRKKLLKLFNLKFKVISSRAEEVTQIKTNCADLVKHNAFIKADDVAKNLKEGIVIGSDSVVYLPKHNKIVGKPKDLKEAKRNLKLLFNEPHWVYTGVAVIDVESKKKIVDFEKTKIFMNTLKDKEIEAYHKIVDPLGKAGGFDIEGWGGIFIRRIEGCYTNVIGLPMAKLTKILKKFGVSILGLILIVNFIGCTSEYNLATKQEESLLYSTEREVRIGENVAMQIMNHYEIINDLDLNERVEKILDKIVSVCDRKELVYIIRIINDEEDTINAVSLPGGYVFIFKEMLTFAKNDDELASVIAHEVGHITARHGIKRLQASYGAMLLQLASIEAGGQAAMGIGLALNSLFMQYSLEDEFEADRLSVKYLKKAGYKPEGIVDFLAKLKEKQEKQPIRPYSYWRTHPFIPQRIAAANKEITGKLEFKDYLNLTEEKW